MPNLYSMRNWKSKGKGWEKFPEYIHKTVSDASNNNVECCYRPRANSIDTMGVSQSALYSVHHVHGFIRHWVVFTTHWDTDDLTAGTVL